MHELGEELSAPDVNERERLERCRATEMDIAEMERERFLFQPCAVEREYGTGVSMRT